MRPLPVLATGSTNTANGYLPVLVSTEKVPFRFTPNLQTFMTPNGVEGVFTSSLMAIARSLTTPEFDMDDYLSLFIRDELNSWQTGAAASPVLRVLSDTQFRDLVQQNVQLVTKRAEALSCRVEREKVRRAKRVLMESFTNNLSFFYQAPDINVPVNQTILDLISMATNPTNLAQQDLTWMCWI